MAELFTTQTANGDSNLLDWQGGDLFIHARGTFDGASLSLQVSEDKGANYTSIATIVSTGLTRYKLPAGLRIKLTLSSAGGSTSLTVTGG